MHKLPALFLAALLMLFYAIPARASGDYGCSRVWTLQPDDASGCMSMAVLSPGNDTRVNLLLLTGNARTATGIPPGPSGSGARIRLV